MDKPEARQICTIIQWRLPTQAVPSCGKLIFKISHHDLNQNIPDNGPKWVLLPKLQSTPDYAAWHSQYVVCLVSAVSNIPYPRTHSFGVKTVEISCLSDTNKSQSQAATCGHERVQGQCHHQGHVDLRGLSCHQNHGVDRARATAEGHV